MSNATTHAAGNGSRLRHVKVHHHHNEPHPWKIVQRGTGRVLASIDGSEADAYELAERIDAGEHRHHEGRR